MRVLNLLYRTTSYVFIDILSFSSILPGVLFLFLYKASNKETLEYFDQYYNIGTLLIISNLEFGGSKSNVGICLTFFTAQAKDQNLVKCLYLSISLNIFQYHIKSDIHLYFLPSENFRFSMVDVKEEKSLNVNKSIMMTCEL